jgi:hypothetical protein
VNAAIQLAAANETAEPVIDEGDDSLDLIGPAANSEPVAASTSNLLDTAPEIAATPEMFERVRKLFSYRGPPRTECDDATWDLLRAAVKSLLPHIAKGDAYSEVPRWIAEALQGLKRSRPVEQLMAELDAVTDRAGHHWLSQREANDAPGTDFGTVLQTAWSFGWSAMSDPPPPEPRDPRAHVLISDFMNQSEPSWLIYEVLMDAYLGVVWGEPNGGKTTIVLEMLLAIARGIKWHGREVEQGAVAWVAAEGAVGLRKRLRAYEKFYGIHRSDLTHLFFPIPSGLNLSNPQDVENLIAYLKTLPTPHRLRVVAIDSWSQVTPGLNENSSEMNLALKACERIHKETGAFILLIAHCGKDQARGIRGWNGVLAALDSEVEVTWDKDADIRAVAVRKQRDGECNFPLFDCTLERVVYGHDGKGRELSSVVVTEAPPQDLPTSNVRRAILDAFNNVRCPVTLPDLIKAAKGHLEPPDVGKKDRRAERIKATYRRMIADNTLKVQGGVISLVIPFGPVAEQPTKDLNGDLIEEVVASATPGGAA